MSAIRINGIRVGHQMLHLRQYPDSEDSEASLLYRTLAGKGINLPCIGVEKKYGHSVSCCLELDLSQDYTAYDPCPVCMVSVYPHGFKSQILGYLLSLFGRHQIGFFHLVSSTAMISFVIAQEDKAGVLAMLEQTFDLPPTHTPYEPGFHEETAAFVKKRYQETRAYFREQRIKTYGFALDTDLNMNVLSCDRDSLDAAGQAIGGGSKFYFATGLGHAQEVSLYWLTCGEETSAPSNFQALNLSCEKADFISFHGPHFGDRFGIFNTAAACLGTQGLEFMLAGCTGASISLVLPAGQGKPALHALEKGFEAP